MTPEQVRRLSVLAGAGVFMLALIGQFARVDPTVALFVAVAVGVVSGVVVFIVGAAISVKPVSGGGAASQVLAPEDVQAPVEEPTLPGLEDMVGPLTETPTDTPVVTEGASPALHQTVRLDEGSVDYVLPEVSPEELFREHEGIDEAFLRQGMGIEGSGAASETIGKADSKAPEEGG